MPHSISSIVPTSPWTIIKSPRLREQHTIPRSLGRGSAIIFGFLFLWGISNPLLRRSIRYSTLGLFDYSLLFHTQRTPPLTEKRERRGAFYKTAEFSLTNSRQQTLSLHALGAPAQAPVVCCGQHTETQKSSVSIFTGFTQRGCAQFQSIEIITHFWYANLISDFCCVSSILVKLYSWWIFVEDERIVFVWHSTHLDYWQSFSSTWFFSASNVQHDSSDLHIDPDRSWWISVMQ